MTPPGTIIRPQASTREKKILEAKYKIFLEAIDIQRRWRKEMEDALLTLWKVLTGQYTEEFQGIECKIDNEVDTAYSFSSTLAFSFFRFFFLDFSLSSTASAFLFFFIFSSTVGAAASVGAI